MTDLAGAASWSLDELYRRYRRPLTAFARRRLHDPAVAEEVVQETFVRLWRSASRFDPERGSLDCLVFTIATRVVIDHLRKARRLPVTEPLIDRAASTADWDAAVVVPEALATLSADHRHVLELAYYGGLTQRQIAERLGLALGTVKTRTYWALKALQRELGEANSIALAA